jgi:hypothetical protein
MAAPAVMDVKYASAVIYNSSADNSASSRREAHLTCPAIAVENTTTAEYEPNFSTVHGASGNIGKR